MHANHHPARQRRSKRAFWFDFGRLLFPELINRPKEMQARMIVLTLALAAILIGAMIGFLHRANDPADILLIQAREAHH